MRGQTMCRSLLVVLAARYGRAGGSAGRGGRDEKDDEKEEWMEGEKSPEPRPKPPWNFADYVC
jgi:hypothetical protein